MSIGCFFCLNTKQIVLPADRLVIADKKSPCNIFDYRSNLFLLQISLLYVTALSVSVEGYIQLLADIYQKFFFQNRFKQHLCLTFADMIHVACQPLRLRQQRPVPRRIHVGEKYSGFIGRWRPVNDPWFIYQFVSKMLLNMRVLVGKKNSVKQHFALFNDNAVWYAN